MSTPIVDSHHHLLDPERIDYRVLRYLPGIRPLRPGPDELAPLLREAGVDRTVRIVQAEESEAKTDYIYRARDRNPIGSPASVGSVPLADPDATAAALERHRIGPLVGVGTGSSGKPTPAGSSTDAVVESIGLAPPNRDSTYDLVPMADAALGRCPDARRTRCRTCAWSSITWDTRKIKDGEWEPWATHLAARCRTSRLPTKLSAMDMSTGSADADAFRRYVRPRPRALRSGPHALGQQLAGFAEAAGISACSSTSARAPRSPDARPRSRLPSSAAPPRACTAFNRPSTTADELQKGHSDADSTGSARPEPDLDVPPDPEGALHQQRTGPALEWEHMWTRTWLLAGRVSDLQPARRLLHLRDRPGVDPRHQAERRVDRRPATTSACTAATGSASPAAATSNSSPACSTAGSTTSTARCTCALDEQTFPQGVDQASRLACGRCAATRGPASSSSI